MAANLVKFLTGTAAEYAALESKDASTLYFVTDTKTLYKGDARYGGANCVAVTELPTTGEINTLYFNTANQSVSYYNGTDFVTIGNSASIAAIEKRLDTLEGDSSTTGSVAKALADAKAYTDNAVSPKANSATTLAGYGITDAYTKTETDNAISTAVANAGHLKREIVSTLPDVASANADTIYMVPDDGETTTAGSSTSSYTEYMLINGAFERIGTSDVDLSNYATKDYADQSEADAVSTAASDATSKANTAESNAKAYADGLATNYATAAQGAKADTAVQSVVAGTNISVVTTDANDATVTAQNPKVSVTGLGTAAFAATGDFATAAQGAKADTAVQSVTATAASGTDGTITVDGTEVAVKGLKSAAYTESSAYATADQGTKADTALQSTDITTGTDNGTIAVKGSDVAVKGLGTAAYTSSEAYATAAQGKKADSAVQSVAESTNNGYISVDGTDVAVHGLGSAAYTASTAYATAAQGAKADTALQVTTLTAGDYITLENNGTTNVTVGVTGVATSSQGSNADAAYNALTWGTIA